MLLQGKCALITGGGSSVGRCVALQLARQGARVVVADCDAELCEESVRTVREAGGEAAASTADIVDEDQVQSMVGDAIVAFGSLDILINGASFRASGDALTTSRDDWQRSLSVNLQGAWLCARYAAPFLKASASGAMVHLAPSDVLHSMPRRFPYAVSKAGILAMSRSLAIDFGPQGIRSNVIITGYIQTERTQRKLSATSSPDDELRRILSVHPLGRVGTPQDVAHAAAFLVSDQAAFITGAVLNVDGGRSAVIQDLHDWES